MLLGEEYDGLSHGISTGRLGFTVYLSTLRIILEDFRGTVMLIGGQTLDGRFNSIELKWGALWFGDFRGVLNESVFESFLRE